MVEGDSGDPGKDVLSLHLRLTGVGSSLESRSLAEIAPV